MISPSCKQHLITTFNSNEHFPLAKHDSVILCKKLKGIPRLVWHCCCCCTGYYQFFFDSLTKYNTYCIYFRSRHHLVTKQDFIDVTIKNIPAKTIETARLTKSKYMLYLTKQTKKSITKLSRKRLYFSRYATDSSLFSWPLNWKHCLESQCI